MSKPGRATREKVFLRKSFSEGASQAKYDGPALSAQDLLVLQSVLAIASEVPPARREDDMDEPVEVQCSFRRLAEVMGLVSAGAGKTTATIVGCVERLGEGVFGWTDSVYERYTEGPLLAALTSTKPALGEGASKPRRSRLHVRLHPRLAEGVRAGRKDTHHLKINMHEVRALKSDSARLLHHRMSQLNVGGVVPHGLDTLASYLMVDDIRALTKHQRRHFVTRLNDAIEELRTIGWTFTNLGELTVTGYPKFDVIRGWSATPVVTAPPATSAPSAST